MVDREELDNHFNYTLPVLERGLKKARIDQVFYGTALFLCMVALAFTWELTLPFGLTMGISTLRILLTLGVGFCAWMGIIGCSWELNAVTAAKKDIANLLRSNGPFQ